MVWKTWPGIPVKTSPGRGSSGRRDHRVNRAGNTLTNSHNRAMTKEACGWQDTQTRSLQTVFHPTLSWLRNEKTSTLSWLLVACFTVAAIAWYSSRHVVLQTAFFGFTPVGMMHPTAFMPGFGADFPNGEGEMMKSLVGWAYRLAGAMGLSDRAGTSLMVGVEAVIMLTGAALLARRTNPHLPRWTAIGAAVLVSAGTIASADFARWFHPYYGAVYNFAFGLGFAALAFTLQKRLVPAGFLIGACAAVHPIIALFTGMAMGISVLVDFRNHRTSNVLWGAFAAAAVFGGWYLFAYTGASITSGSVDADLFTTLTRLMSSHWHPIGLEIFGARAWEVLLPFSALVLVFASTLALGTERTATSDRQMTAALGALIIVSLLGLWLSEHSTNPLLIKLALHRASLIVLLLAAIVCVPRLITLAASGPWIAAIVGASLVLLPFWRGHGLPVAGAMAFSLIVVTGMAGVTKAHSRVPVFIALGLAVLVCIVLALNGHTAAIIFDIRATVSSIVARGFIIASLLMLAARYLRAPALAAAAVLVGVYFWAPQNDPMRTPELREQAESTLEVQEWARDQTQPGSLFMLDPTISYAWRQYSQRPSFGTLREWLYSGWAYNTDPEIMVEGIRRAGLLDITLADIRPRAGQSIDGTYQALVNKARGAFATMATEDLSRLAADNNIAYYVFDRTTRDDFSGLDVEFENDRFVVAKAPG